MESLHLQRIVDVVAFPTHVFVIDLHVKRQRELAVGEHRIEMSRQRLENMFAGLLAGCEISSFAKPQHHGEKAEVLPAVGDGIVIASDGTDTNAAEREDAGLNRSLADQFDDFPHIDVAIDVGGIFDREMRHFSYSSNSGGCIKRSSN